MQKVAVLYQHPLLHKLYLTFTFLLCWFMFQGPLHVQIIYDRAAGQIGEMKAEESGARCF